VAGVFRYSPEATQAILELSELKPYLIQKLCVHAINAMIEAGRTTVTLADIETAQRTGSPEDAVTKSVRD
jgi:histone H3/H4